MAGNKPTTKIKNHKEDRVKGKKILTSSQDISESSSSGSPQKSLKDLSVLRRSIPTSIVGFRQIRKLYDTATEEVQNLLTNECDFIYECRVCRNIFRSLANFLSHKRIYCKQKFNKSLHAHFMATSFLNDDSTEIYFDSEDNEKLNSRTGSYVTSQKKDLTSIIDKLGHREANNKLGLLEYYDEIKYRIAQKDAYRSEHAIRLDDIEGNNSAVFQTVVKKDNCDTQAEFMLDEVIELHDMLWKENAVMGPDGKLLAIDSNGQIKEPKVVASKFSDDEDEVKCEICSLEFKTRKTLLYHIKSKHSTSHLHYPCPSCSDIFSTAGAVYRHLCKVHNNTMITIRKLRDQILNKAFTLDNASKKMLDRINRKGEETTSKNENHDENETWMLDFEMDFDSLRCSGCGRKFERKAAFSSHQLICKTRIQTQNKFLTNSMKKIGDDVDNEDSLRNGRKNKIPMKRIKNGKDLNSEIASTMQVEVIPTSEVIKNDDVHKTSTSVNSDNQLATINVNNKAEEISNAEGATKLNDINVNIKVNKRKRQHTTRIIAESADDSEDLYWEMGDDGTINVKRPKEELSTEADTVTDDLKRKMLSLINEKKLQCLPCKRIFPSMTNLKRHIALHMKWKRFQCGLCSAQFYHRSECVYHLGRAHNMMGDKQFVDSLIIPMKPQESEIHVDNDLCANADEDTSKTSDAENNLLNESQKSSIDRAIDDVVQKYTEHSSNSDDNDPLSNDDASVSMHAESVENSDCKDSINESDISSTTKEKKSKNDSDITPVRKRGRPKSVFTEKSNEDDENREKRGRGRPKGSLNKDKKKKTSPNKSQTSTDNDKPETEKPKDQDKMRKMVLEVIFGGEKKEEKEIEDADIKSEDPISPADTDVSCASTDYEIKTKFTDPTDNRSCRPIRNRVKVVNKDFVYDLSDLLKKEAEAYKESQYTVAYGRFKKRSNSVMPVESLQKDIQSSSVSPTNSMKWESTDLEQQDIENSILPHNLTTLDDKNSVEEMNSESKSLGLFDEELIDDVRNKDSLCETEFKTDERECYKPNDSMEDITVIPVNVSNNNIDDSCSSSDEMPLLEINMAQDVDSNDEELNDPLEADNIIISDPEGSCPDISGENYNKVAPIQYSAKSCLVSRSVLKPSQPTQTTEKSVSRVYIRKPSGDLQEIIFESPMGIENNEVSASIVYESEENHVTHGSEFEIDNTVLDMRDKDDVLHIIDQSMPLVCDSSLEGSTSDSDEFHSD